MSKEFLNRQLGFTYFNIEMLNYIWNQRIIAYLYHMYFTGGTLPQNLLGTKIITRFKKTLKKF